MSTVKAVAAKRGLWAIVFSLLLITATAAPGFADSPEGSSPPGEEQPSKESSAPLPSSEEIEEGINGEGPALTEPELTNPVVAEEEPHKDLGRSEAEELLEGVFGTELSAPAEIFDELHVEKFLAPNVALIPAGEQPEGPSLPGNKSAPQYNQPTLMDSAIPLSTENADGNLEAVDLSLETGTDELHPVNPLVDVSLPAELGDGIGLPGPGIGIDLKGAPEERAPSKIEGSVAFYPNVANDTDVAISPNAGGVETLTQLRSADAPTEQTYDL
jgi:hypothetical protein